MNPVALHRYVGRVWVRNVGRSKSKKPAERAFSHVRSSDVAGTRKQVRGVDKLRRIRIVLTGGLQ